MRTEPDRSPNVWTRLMSWRYAQHAIVAASMLGPLLFFVLDREAGSFVEDMRFLQSAIAIGARLYPQPVDPALRVLNFDPTTLAELGRQPTRGEIERIAAMLADAGIERVLVPGFNELQGASRAADAPGGRVAFAAAVAVGGEDERGSFVDARALAPRLLAASRALDASKYPHAKIVTPRHELSSAVGSLGFIDPSPGPRVRAAYQVGDGLLLPNLALLAAAGLRVAPDDGFATAHGRVPLESNGTVFLHPLSERTIATATTSMAPFWSQPGGVLVPSLPAAVKARLAGGTVAVILTGGSVIGGSFSGLTAAERNLISLASNALSGRFLHCPGPRQVIVTVVAVLIYGFIMAAPAMFSALALVCILTLFFPVAVGLVVFQGVYLPFAEIVLIASGGIFWRTLLTSAAAAKASGRLEKELEMGRTVQRLLLPQRFEGRVGPWEFNVVFRPHGPLSGDWVQIAEIESGGDAIAAMAIGDVVGKGPGAALMTAAIATVWNECVDAWSKSSVDLTDLLRRLERATRGTFKGEQTTTISIAVLRRDSIVLSCCGCPQWMIADAKGDVRLLRHPTRDPLGCGRPVDGAPSIGLTPAPGDLYFAYTDGVMEGGRAFSAFKRSLQAELAAGAPGARPEFAQIERLARAAGRGTVRPDDSTMLMIRYVGDVAADADAAPAAS